MGLLSTPRGFLNKIQGVRLFREVEYMNRAPIRDSRAIRRALSGQTSVQSRPKVSSKLVQNWSNVSPKSAQSYCKGRQTRPKVGPKLIKSPLEVRTKSTQSRPKVGPKSTQSWPRVGPIVRPLLSRRPRPPASAGSRPPAAAGRRPAPFHRTPPVWGCPILPAQYGDRL